MDNKRVERIGIVVFALAIIGILAIVGANLGEDEDLASNTATTAANTATTTPVSAAYKLAVIDGDPSEESAFQAAIDCIMASGIKGAETEEKVGDTLVASWQESGQRDSLLEWAQAFC